MAEDQLRFEGMEVQEEAIKLGASYVAGLGHLRIGDKVTIQGTAVCCGVQFMKDRKTGHGQRIHILADADLIATEVITDEALRDLGN